VVPYRRGYIISAPFVKLPNKVSLGGLADRCVSTEVLTARWSTLPQRQFPDYYNGELQPCRFDL
jgi:hypothetical protein